MSIKSSLLRGIYGVELKPKLAKSKYAFYREEDLKREDIRRRSQPRFNAALKKKLVRQSRRKAV
jgi:hypothetical protein